MPERSRIRISVLACENCGAPMYPDMKLGGFRCLYCDNFHPFAVTFEDFAPPVKFRHKPVEIVDDMLKLGHVAIEDKDALDPPPQDERTRRLLAPDLKILSRDAEAYHAIHDQRCYELTCPHCGQHLRVLLAEGIFTCPYCNNKFGEQEQIATGKYDERLVIGRKLNLYSSCLPFALPREAALRKVQELARYFAEDLHNMQTEDLTRQAEKELIATYIPVQLADLRWKMQAECEQGTFWYYQECLDWAWPRSIIYDMYLLDELAPWNYGELTALKPAYLEGNIQLLASENLGEWQRKIPNWMLQRTAPRRLKEAFGLDWVQLRWISRDLRQHTYGLVLLPIYSLEFLPADGNSLVRVMVNGQTGKAALQISTDTTDFTRTLAPAKKIPMSPESTILSPPIPVRYISSPFLHKRLSFSAALSCK